MKLTLLLAINAALSLFHCCTTGSYVNKAAFLNREPLDDASQFVAPPDLQSSFNFDQPSDPFVEHEVVFALRQRNLDELDALVLRVSTPASPQYGHYKSRAEVAAMTAPAPESIATVMAYLRRSGASNVRSTRFGEYVVASAPVIVWEAVFEAVFYEVTPKWGYRDGGPPAVTYRAHRIVMPEPLRNHVIASFNTVQMPAFPALMPGVVVNGGPVPSAAVKQMFAPRPGEADAPPPELNEPFPLDGFTFPRLLEDTYNIGRGHRGSRQATQAVFESAAQLLSEADLNLFQTAFALPVERVAEDVGGHIVAGPCRGVQICAEANLGA